MYTQLAKTFIVQLFYTHTDEDCIGVRRSRRQGSEN